MVGDLAIVLDWYREPEFVTRCGTVGVIPFDEVSAEYAAREGEGDLSLDYWRGAHWAFFSRECARIGRKPAPNRLVACCECTVVHELPIT